MLPEVISGSIGIVDTITAIRPLCPRTNPYTRMIESIDLEGKRVVAAGKGSTSLCVAQPKFQKATGIFVNNQFGPSQVDTTKEEELCVPSELPLPA